MSLRTRPKSSGEDITFNANASLITDLNYDSFSFIELIVNLERIFKIEIDAEELTIENLSSPQEILNLVQAKVGRKNHDSKQ